MHQRETCGHQICLTCFREFILQSVYSGNALRIPCPEDGCMYQIYEEEVKQFLSPADFAKYLQFKKNKLLEQDDNVRWCIAPGCNTILRRENPK